MPSAASAISGECAATETGRTMRAPGAHRSGELGAGLDRGSLARDDDLSGCVPVGHHEHAGRRRRGDQLGKPRIVESDQRRHRSIAALPRRLHQPPALSHEPDTVLERHGTRRHERRVLAHRMAGREPGCRRRASGGGPSLAKGGQDRDRGRQEGRLGVLGEIEPLGRAVPGQRADRFAKRQVRGGIDGSRGAGGSAARARPMPTDWDPCPGKTKASEDIMRRVRRPGRRFRGNSHARLHTSSRSLVPCDRAHRSPQRPPSDTPGSGPVDRATVRGRPLGARPGRRQPAAERPPDQRARGDGTCALARAGDRLCRPARGAAPRVHPARRAVRAGRRQHAHGRASSPRRSGVRRRPPAASSTASSAAGWSSATRSPRTSGSARCG